MILSCDCSFQSFSFFLSFFFFLLYPCVTHDTQYPQFWCTWVRTRELCTKNRWIANTTPISCVCGIPPPPPRFFHTLSPTTPGKFSLAILSLLVKTKKTLVLVSFASFFFFFNLPFSNLFVVRWSWTRIRRPRKLSRHTLQGSLTG